MEMPFKLFEILSRISGDKLGKTNRNKYICTSLSRIYYNIKLLLGHKYVKEYSAKMLNIIFANT